MCPRVGLNGCGKSHSHSDFFFFCFLFVLYPYFLLRLGCPAFCLLSLLTTQTSTHPAGILFYFRKKIVCRCAQKLSVIVLREERHNERKTLLKGVTEFLCAVFTLFVRRV